MKLGLGRNEVRIADYNSGWKAEFESVKKVLMESTGLEEKRIEHIGSTAIKHIQSKPIIDLLVVVDKLASVDKPLLQSFKKASFLRLKVERPGEIVLANFKDNSYQVKTHFIHLVEYQEPLWNNLIFFRDYLNDNEYARNRYLKIKEEFLKSNSEGIREYTDYKETFVKEIIDKRT